MSITDIYTIYKWIYRFYYISFIVIVINQAAQPLNQAAQPLYQVAQPLSQGSLNLNNLT
jgi:hypothetical protein